MTKKKREAIKQKYGGRCAYSGTVLDDDWQIDHLIPKRMIIQKYNTIKNHDNIENLIPCQKIINHYKRSMSLHDFRTWYMKDLHKRLKKLPKNPKVQKSIKHKEYLLKVASYFGITEDKPFSGIFYFETIKN